MVVSHCIIFWTILISLASGECAAGGYVNSITGNCELCAINTYTDQPDQKDCTECSNGKTAPKGSVSQDACADPCPKGSYINAGNCELCGINSYTDQLDQTECIKCDLGKTSTPGAVSVDACTEPCLTGSYINSGICEACSVNSYTDKPDQTQCTPCPARKLAPKGSKSVADCIGTSIILNDGTKTFKNYSSFRSDINSEVNKEINALKAELASTQGSSDIIWMIFSACLVFWMQAGFAMVEVGSVSMKNTKNILTKNMMDACIGCLSFYLIGYAFAFGGSNVFIGGTDFALANFHGQTTGPSYSGYDYSFWVFQFAFAATAATIVSGAVAERCRICAYFSYSFALTSFIYPVVVHWAWSSYGWASAFVAKENRLFGVGAIDFAGSTVVHMVGGITALIGAIFLGPRRGRYGNNKWFMPQQSAPFQTLGVFILWLGWYGFNCGSTLGMGGRLADVAGAVACTTTIAAAASGATATILGWFVEESFSIGRTNNGILGGLVSITAGCSVVSPEISLVIGIIGGCIYFASSKLLEKLEVDDVVDASPVHMFCGIWGTFAVGLFAHPEYVEAAYGTGSCGLFYKCNGLGPNQFGANCVFLLAVIVWVGIMAFIVFGILKMTKLLRVDLETERVGLDISEHGGGSYEINAPVKRKSHFYGQNAHGTIIENLQTDIQNDPKRCYHSGAITGPPSNPPYNHPPPRMGVAVHRKDTEPPMDYRFGSVQPTDMIRPLVEGGEGDKEAMKNEGKLKEVKEEPTDTIIDV